MPIDGDIILKAGLDTTGVSGKIDELQKTVSKGIKNIIRLGFGVRSVYALIRKMRTALFKGFGDLAKVHEPFNEAMSSIMTSLRLLRNTFASSFAPIIETVAPILTTFINLIAKAVASVGQFIAALTGKQYVQAGTVQVDYAKSLDKSTSSSNSATKATKAQTKAQKELNREITHFDDLVILHDKSKDDTDTTPTTTTEPSSTFTPMPVGEAVSSFAKDFLAAWNKADFTDIGRIVGEKLKNALDNIPWEKIQATTRKIAHSVATFLNGFLETPGLFTSIGKTVGNAINTALAGLSTFAWTFHWGSLGKAISDAMKAALGTINWDDAFSAAQGFGTGLAEYLNGLFDEDTFELLGDTVAQLINTALEFLCTFGETFEFEEFGRSIGKGVNKALAGINTDRLIAGITVFVRGVKDAIISFLSSVNWYEFGYTLRDLIKKIPWKLILLSIGAVIWQAINSAIEVLKGLFDTDNITSPFTNALNTVSETLQKAADDIDFEAIADGIGAIVKAIKPAAEGFGAGLLTVLNKFLELGIDFLTWLGPALQDVADAISTVPPETLEAIGEALGVIVGAIITVKVLSLVPILGGLVEGIIGLGTHAGTTALALGSTGLAGAVATLGAAVIGLGIGFELSKEKIATDEEEWSSWNKIIAEDKEILSGLKSELGLTDEQLSDVAETLELAASPNVTNASEQYAKLEKRLEDAGVDIEAFRTGIANAAVDAKNSGPAISSLEKYVGDVGASAETSDTQVSDLGEVFDVFNGLSISTPLKLALLGLAFKSLGENGALSQEEVDGLQTTLDNVDVNNPNQGMKDVQTEFSKTGIGAGKLKTSIIGAMLGISATTSENMDASIKAIQDAGPSLKTESKKSFKNVADGAKKGLDDNASKVVDAAGTMMGDTLDELDETAESNSPSKRTIRLGGYIAEGLKIGINNLKPTLITTASVTINAIMTTMKNLTPRFTPIGSGYVGAVINGINSMAYRMYSTGSGMGNSAKNGFASVSFWGVGYNAGVGIYNGLVATSSWLRTLAWNTAVAMYNAACKALNIASPSKKFAYVGEMVARGLGKGVDDYQDVATDAVTDMTDAMLEEAQTANTSVQFDTTVGSWIDSLDNVLTEFSNTIIDRFDNLINVLVQLSNVSSFVPAVAQGKVIPSSLRAANDTADTTSALMGMLENLTMNQMTAEDLRPLLVEMFTQYMNLSWRIGDEQLAYHVNRGNLSLERRYSTR